MKISSQIVIGFVVIIMLLSAIAWISDRNTQQVRQEQLEYVKETTQIISLTAEMERKLYRSLVQLNVIREWNMLSDQTVGIQQLPSKIELIRRFENNISEFKVASNQIQQLIDDNGQVPDSFNELTEKARLYESLAEEWLKLGNEDLEQANFMFLNSIQPYFLNNIIPLIQDVQDYSIQVQNDRDKNLEANLEGTRQLFLIFLLITFLIACVVAFYFYQFVASKIQKLNETVRKVGEGNLSVRAEVKSVDEIGELAGSFNDMILNLEQKTVSRQYLNNIIESLNEALFVTNDKGEIQKVNRAAGRMLGYPVAELQDMKLSDLRDDGELNVTTVDAYMSQEINLRHNNGELIPVAMSMSALKNIDNLNIGSLIVATDITERKEKELQIRESLNEKEVLLAEIHHRVKNNLAVISGLLQLQSFAEENEDVAKALIDSQSRIKSIALIHEMLYQSESLAFIEYDIYIKDLLEAVESVQGSEDKEVAISTDLEKVSLNVNQAIPCSLILNELVTNIFKHAFNKTGKGEIRVGMKEMNGKVVLTILDNGSGFDLESAEKQRSLGFTLINTLTEQLRGTINKDESVEQGTCFVLTFKKEINTSSFR